MTLFEIEEGIRQCTACPLHKERMIPCPGDGDTQAKVMFIGEAPGNEEDRTGKSFVGRSGAVLDEMLAVANLQRTNVFITGTCKCHPPNNRNPTKEEATTCKDTWLTAQMNEIRPKLIVLLGRVAIETLVGPKRVSEHHGTVIRKGGWTFFLTYHPAAALRFPKFKDDMKKDFQKLTKYL